MNYYYILFANLGFAFMVLVFDTLLAKTTSYKSNRWLLLALPILAVGLYLFKDLPRAVVPMFQTVLPVFEVGKMVASASKSNPLNWLGWVYVMVSMALFAFSIQALWGQFFSGEATTEKVAGFAIRTIHSKYSYSFLNRMYLNKTDFNNSLIREHELAHLQQYHWLDNVLAQLVVCLFWFNPLVWRWRNLILQNHEFLADNKVISKNTDQRKRYAELLLDNALSTNHFSIQNYFSKHSLISNRIVMLQSKKGASPIRWLLASTLIVSGMLYLGACTKNGEVVGNQQEVDSKQEEALTKVDQMPEYKGGTQELYAFLGKNLKYPQNCKDEGVEGIAYVSFVIAKDGKVEGAKVLKSVHPDIDAEALRVISLMPNWIPGKHNGKLVRVVYNLPLNFKLKEEVKD